MDYFLTIDWAATFAPQLTLPEVLVRGTVVYVAMLVLFRLIPKWQAGTGTIASMLFVVVLGDLASEAVKGKADSVTDLLLMAATVMLWAFLVDWLSYRFPRFHFLAQDEPTPLIRNGRMLYHNLRREMMSEDDLRAQLRRQDVDDIRNVLEAQLEADGSISVVNRKEAQGKATTEPSADGNKV